MTLTFIDFRPMSNRTLVYAYAKIALARALVAGATGNTSVEHGQAFWKAFNLATKELAGRLGLIADRDGYTDAGQAYTDIRAAALDVANATAVKTALATAPAGWVPLADATAWEVAAEDDWTSAHRRLELASDRLVAVLNDLLPDRA